MGKDFEKELGNLGLVYREACAADIRTITDFLRKYINQPFLGVGSGGSHSVARIFEFLCIKGGGIAKSLTPLELTLFNRQIKEMAVLLFTAGGRNADSIHAYQYLSELEPEGLLTCCMCKDAPIKQVQKDNLHNYYFEYKMPVKKDGYLAVESLVSSTVFLCRAFENLTGNQFFRIPDMVLWGSQAPQMKQVEQVLTKETLIILHGGITTPAAIDLESKFSEASLGNIQLVDFRNFAHGRHYWLSDRKERTAIVSMAGSSVEKIVNKTLNLLPQEIPVLRFDVDDETVLGLFKSFDFIFQLVLQAGVFQGVNPGKPKVADFGKKLYHLNYNICNNISLNERRKNPVAVATYRKCKAINSCETEKYREHGNIYLQTLTNKIFKGIVFDYDGTLHNKGGSQSTELAIIAIINRLLSNNIKIGVATGRGKSVRNELQRVIQKNFWKDVIIAYYNGGCLGLLEDDQQPDKESIAIPDAFIKLKQQVECTSGINQLEIDGITDRNPFQLTILMNGHQNISSREQIISLCDHIPGIKILQSSHSIDIIPVTSSKINIFDFWGKLGYSQDDFIIIGDAGQVGGNDYEMLNCANALSVDRVSERFDSCWNFAKPGLRNLEATLYYLEHIVLCDRGEFSLNL